MIADERVQIELHRSSNQNFSKSTSEAHTEEEITEKVSGAVDDNQ